MTIISSPELTDVKAQQAFLSPILTGDNPSQTRREILNAFVETWDTYERLFECIIDERGFYEKAIPLRHPLIFYYGHTATFFMNKLVLAKLLPERIDPEIEAMCAVGVDEMSWDDLDEANYKWPSIRDIEHYRSEVKAKVVELIQTIDLSLPISWDSPMWPILMGIEHERIHLETSSVLIRQLPISYVKPHPDFTVCPETGDAPQNLLKSVPAGQVKIDEPKVSDRYGWDNEYGHHQASVKAFSASQFLVSNQEFLAFVEDGGYENPKWWDEEGNRWRGFTSEKHPTFWRKKTSGSWKFRTMTQEIEMPWDWPVEVNNLEAMAFCNWKAHQSGLSIRLPTEDEYLQLRQYCSQFETQGKPNRNLEGFASSQPVNRCQQGDFFDVEGNVWQWTCTAIYPFEGFEVHPLYDDFTTPTFDNQHYLIKGGSWISTGNEINGRSRYAFRRHFFQHAGFRYVEAEPIDAPDVSPYETDESVAQYCGFHYGQTYFGVKNFSDSYAEVAIQAVMDDPDLRSRPIKALEAGCSVGRACFEMGKIFTDVTGIDFSARFIQVADRLKKGETVRYTLPIEGDIQSFESVKLSDFRGEIAADKVTFMQQDAMNMKPIYTGYDVIVAVNLIDRLSNPALFIDELVNRVASKGLVIISSPYTWLESFTPKENWLGGKKVNGENQTSFEALSERMAPNFELVKPPQDLPFVIRETSRKFQHSLSQLSIWKKRS